MNGNSKPDWDELAKELEIAIEEMTNIFSANDEEEEQVNQDTDDNRVEHQNIRIQQKFAVSAAIMTMSSLMNNLDCSALSCSECDLLVKGKCLRDRILTEFVR